MCRKENARGRPRLRRTNLCFLRTLLISAPQTGKSAYSVPKIATVTVQVMELTAAIPCVVAGATISNSRGGLSGVIVNFTGAARSNADNAARQSGSTPASEDTRYNGYFVNDKQTLNVVVQPRFPGVVAIAAPLPFPAPFARLIVLPMVARLNVV